MNLNEQGIDYLNSKGLSIEAINTQLDLIRKGTKFLNLVRPASITDGIIQISNIELDKIEKKYSQLISNKTITKFIPASGAASRMFKDLYSYLDNGDVNTFIITFIAGIKKFAFYNELEQSLKLQNLDIDTLLKTKDYKTIIEFLITDKGLNYGKLPKGLLSFHKNEDSISTPIVEHVKEAIAYCGAQPKLSFTISEIFKSKFETEINKALKQFNKDFEYQLSYQKSKTDTVASTSDFNLVETKNNEFLIRPGGHGSLIENLNDVNSDIIFIKNIDNVCSEKYLEETALYKKALVSILLQKQHTIFNYLEKLEDYDGKDELLNNKIETFFKEELNIHSDALLSMNTSEKVQFYKAKLNRPIRVCGMVKNEGEPGGGPFWVKDEEDTLGLQIVESLQINLKKNDQASILSNSSHFNPVDIVCSVKDNNNKKYDLTAFVDKDAVFVTEKSYQGKTILALEHPGLWNGGMGNWNTIFVEVSSKTFNPVKTVNDLLRDTHQQ